MMVSQLGFYFLDKTAILKDELFFLILIIRFSLNGFEVLFSPLIQNEEFKECDQQYTFLILIESLIDERTISKSSDNNKHAISSRRGIDVVCKGDTRVFDADEIL